MFQMKFVVSFEVERLVIHFLLSDWLVRLRCLRRRRRHNSIVAFISAQQVQFHIHVWACMIGTKSFFARESREFLERYIKVSKMPVMARCAYR